MTKRLTMNTTGSLFDFEVRPVVQTNNSTAPSDQGAREQALDTTQSWIVEAPAGSGKTGLLIQRYLKLLSQPEIQQPEQVLAITFTIKAAGEIRERVLDQLLRAGTTQQNTLSSDYARQIYHLATSVLERDAQLGWNICHNPRRLNIRTIDSICAEIARGLPVLSGSSGLKPVEDAQPLYRLATERTLRQLGGRDARLNNALELVLLHRDGDLHRCRELLREMLALRDQWGRLIPLDRTNLDDSYLDAVVLPRLESTLKEAIQAELIILHKEFPRNVLERLSTAAAQMADSEGYRGGQSPITACSGKHFAPEPEAFELERWQAFAHLLLTKKHEWRQSFTANHIGFQITEPQKVELEEMLAALSGKQHLLDLIRRVRSLPSASYPPEQWSVAKALFVVLHQALIELQLVFAERGECDFTELGLLARATLNNTEGGADSPLGASIQHLLVDEMQDTSTSQYELVELLTQGWDGRSQTIFLVGDPKQSIYLFRQARVERFIRAMRELQIGDVHIGSLQLTANFRSQSGLVKAFNDNFQRLFPSALDADFPEEAPYTAAVAIRENAAAELQNMVWHPQIISSNASEERSAQKYFEQAEALEVRRVIERWKAKPLPPGREKPWSIAVLVRNRNHLTQIIAELKRSDNCDPIPFRAIDIESLRERPEVLDLYSLTRALLHPGDRVAWLSVLRAPWCGLQLRDLHLLCGEDEPGYEYHTILELIEARGELLSDEGCHLLARIAPLFVAINKQLARIPVSELVERTWRSLGGDVYLDEKEATNAERFLWLLNDMESKGVVIDFSSLSRRLEQLYAAPSPDTNAVDLLTIHGAKGLEWDVVLLPGLAKRSHTDTQKLLTWNEITVGNEAVSDVILAPITGKGRDSEALNQWLDGIHRRREKAECKRLFYVACTRAKEELHLFATLKLRKDGSLAPPPGTLLSAAWPAAEEHFVKSTVPSKPLIARVITVKPIVTSSVLPSIAAEERGGQASQSLRLPLDFESLIVHPPLDSSYTEVPATETFFARPEGTFESRAFGNVVHAMLEAIAKRLVDGSIYEGLLHEIRSWAPRVELSLRSFGLSLSTCSSLTPRVLQALENTLQDTEGRWILKAHKNAASEYALNVWKEVDLSFRLDRIFIAGEAPLQPDAGYTWIIDFKTTDAPDGALDKFIEAERQKYRAQMETYARVVSPRVQADKLRVGLYYPLLPKLVWWTPNV